MTTDRTFAAYWRGRDAIEGDRCPFTEGTPEANAWRHGYYTMLGEDRPELWRPMTDAEVAAAFAVTRCEPGPRVRVIVWASGRVRSSCVLGGHGRRTEVGGPRISRKAGGPAIGYLP